MVSRKRAADSKGKSPHNQSTSPSIFVSLSPAKPSVVFDTYWRFAAERQRIFFARLQGLPPPWTNDSILNTYKFTNAYRASDRVSQFLIKNVIYREPYDPRELFFRIILFKLFNKIETWSLLEESLGDIRWNYYRFSDYERILSGAMATGQSIYSAAYIMASGAQVFEVERKHQGHLKLIELMINDSVPERLMECRSMRSGFELLRSYPLIGDFLAYQLITDLNYSPLLNFTEMEFTIPGPGARDGIRKCFASLGGLSETDIIRLMADRQCVEFENRGIQFQSLWGRSLQLIDVQNLFCEVDKYARIKHPNIAGLSGRTRIKQKYVGRSTEIQYFFPPKWKLAMPHESKSLLPPLQPKLI